MSNEPLLSVHNLATGYGDLRVVWDASFDVKAGELTVLLGRNGAGKTTILRAITGLNRIAGGSVQLDGKDISKLSGSQRVRRGMSYVQEGKRVIRAQTVEQNLLLGGITRKITRGQLRAEVEGIYDLFPILHEKKELLAGSMSGGQQQMLAIGSALMARPRLLLLDEPSGGLAPVIVKEVMQRVAELKSTGIGVLLVEQAVEASIAIADHVAVLDMGRTVLSAPADQVSDIEVLKDAYFGRHGTNPNTRGADS